jgi:prepilin peptidase CpaA
VAAVIDGWMLKVPNWLTFPMIASGWIYSVTTGGWAGLGYSLLGTIVGFGLLFFLYAIGGMGAGDVKLLAGIGAWVHAEHTLYIFAATAIVGAIMAVIMVGWSGNWIKHYIQFHQILGDIFRIRNSDVLFEQAAERKPRMLLLPYGIPMTVAALGYFFVQGMY